jgi:hypothetical protein
MSDTFKRAYMAIEDDVCLVRSGAGVLHLAFHDLSEDGKDKSALAQSLFFAAVNIEAACQRIEARLCGKVPEIETAEPCACHRDEAAP